MKIQTLILDHLFLALVIIKLMNWSRGGARTGPSKGANFRASVRITFLEAVFGWEKELELTIKDPCPTCHGTGAKPGTSAQTCSKCGGKEQIVYTQQSFFGTVRNVQTCPECGGSNWRKKLC